MREKSGRKETAECHGESICLNCQHLEGSNYQRDCLIEKGPYLTSRSRCIPRAKTTVDLSYIDDIFGWMKKGG